MEQEYPYLPRLRTIDPLIFEKAADGGVQGVVRRGESERRHSVIPSGSKVLRLLGERAAKALSPGRQITGGEERQHGSAYQSYHENLSW